MFCRTQGDVRGGQPGSRRSRDLTFIANMRLPQMLAITQAVAFMQPPLQPPTRLQAMSSGSSRILRTVSSFRHSAPDRFGRLGRPIAPLQSRTLVAMSASKFPTKLRGVLFDMDGTLSDSESLHFKAYQVVFAKEVPELSVATPAPRCAPPREQRRRLAACPHKQFA